MKLVNGMLGLLILVPTQSFAQSWLPTSVFEPVRSQAAEIVKLVQKQQELAPQPPQVPGPDGAPNPGTATPGQHGDNFGVKPNVAEIFEGKAKKPRSFEVPGKSGISCQLNKTLELPAAGQTLGNFCKVGGRPVVDLVIGEEELAYLSQAQIFGAVKMCGGAELDSTKATLAFKKMLEAKLLKLCKRAALAMPAFQNAVNNVSIGIDAIATVTGAIGGTVDCAESSILEIP